MARDYSQMSKCRKIKVGCMIVNNGRIVSTGVNGTPKGTCNCTDHFYNLNDKEFAVAHSAWSTEHEVHAEMNALLYAAKSNVEVTSDCILYCTHEPCNNCLKHIAVTGIKQIYYIEKYYNNTADNKYKINITQLSIDDIDTDPSKEMDPKEIELIKEITKNSSLDALFDIYPQPNVEHRSKVYPPREIYVNGRKQYYEFGEISFLDLVYLAFGTVTNPELYHADYKFLYENDFHIFLPNTLVAVWAGTQFRCTGSTPVPNSWHDKKI